MNEDALRALVRETIARLNAVGGSDEPAPFTAVAHPIPLAPHVSQYRYAGLPETDGPCLIEPTVQCNHCGYCQSHGH